MPLSLLVRDQIRYLQKIKVPLNLITILSMTASEQHINLNMHVS